MIKERMYLADKKRGEEREIESYSIATGHVS
jgi:hypothetical protein